MEPHGIGVVLPAAGQASGSFQGNGRRAQAGCAYGAFYQTALRDFLRYIDRKLERWAQRKYRKSLRHTRRNGGWLNKMRNVHPRLFEHWRVVEM